MNHGIFVLSIFGILLATSSMVMAFMVHLWKKDELYKYVAYLVMGVGVMMIFTLIAVYISVSKIQLGEIGDVLQLSGLYLIMAFVWFLMQRSMYRMMSVRFSSTKRIVHTLIAFLPFFVHMFFLVCAKDTRVVLGYIRDILAAFECGVFLYILVRHHKRLLDKDMKVFINIIIAVLCVFTPWFVVESAVRGIMEFYAAIGIVWPSPIVFQTLVVIATFRFLLVNGIKPAGPAQARSAKDIFLKCGLTDRETEVVFLLAGRRSYREICADLSISLATVKSHVHRAFQKMDVGTRGELTELIEGLNK